MLMPRGRQADVYVPYAKREAGGETHLTRTPLPPGTARRSASDVLRTIRWDESVTVDPVAAPPARLDNPSVPAGAFFRRINWTGEEEVAPTPAQTKTSVRAQLDQFKWD